jgi:hypothetical protein
VRAQLIQLRIDLHRVDVLGAHVEGVRDVVAGPGPDYEDIIQRVANSVHQARRGARPHPPCGHAALLYEITDDEAGSIITRSYREADKSEAVNS